MQNELENYLQNLILLYKNNRDIELFLNSNIVESESDDQNKVKYIYI